MKESRRGSPGVGTLEAAVGKEGQGEWGQVVDPEGWAGVTRAAKVPVGLGPPRPRQGACPIRRVEGPGRLCLNPSECCKLKADKVFPLGWECQGQWRRPAHFGGWHSRP